MKFRNEWHQHGAEPGRLVVALPDFDLQQIDARWLDHANLVSAMTDINESARVHGATELLVLGDSPSVAVEAVSVWLAEDGHRLVLGCTAGADDVATALFELSDDYCITHIDVGPTLMMISVEAAVDGDGSIDQFVTGYNAGLRAGTIAADKANDFFAGRRKITQLITNYYALLEHIEKIGLAPGPIQTTPQGHSTKADDEINLLTKRVLELEREGSYRLRQFEALEKKYQALASSRLGAITLARWERKRKKNGS